MKVRGYVSHFDPDGDAIIQADVQGEYYQLILLPKFRYLNLEPGDVVTMYNGHVERVDNGKWTKEELERAKLDAIELRRWLFDDTTR